LENNIWSTSTVISKQVKFYLEPLHGRSTTLLESDINSFSQFWKGLVQLRCRSFLL